MLNEHLDHFYANDDFPIVKLIAYEPQEFLLVEEVAIVLDYPQFLAEFAHSKYDRNFKPWLDLIDFARKTAMFRLIGDFREDQLVYTRKGWKIIDWLDGSVRARSVNDPSLFNIHTNDAKPVLQSFETGLNVIRESSLPLPIFPLWVERTIIKAIQDERTKAGLRKQPTFFDQCESVLVELRALFQHPKHDQHRNKHSD